MAAVVHSLYDESDGLSKRVGNTGDRLNNVQVQFEQDQESINEVSLSTSKNIYYQSYPNKNITYILLNLLTL